MYAHRDAGGPMPGAVPAAAAAAAAIPERETPGPGRAPGAGPGAVPVPEDGAAFAALYQRYRPQLIAYCRRRLREDWREAEDAAHEALLRAYCALPSLDASTDAWPWLATIAARVCADVRRRNARMVAVPASVVEVGGAGAIGAVGLVVRADDVHEQVARRLRADIVEGALGRLPARYRTSLFLKEFAGWTCGEIAHIQGTSVAAVRSVLVRGRRRLGTGVEELARSRGQWPLPTVVPTVAARARARLREWRESARDALGRPGGSLLGAFEVSTLATRLLVGAHATLVGAIALSGAAVGALQPFETGPVLLSTHPAVATTPAAGPARIGTPAVDGPEVATAPADIVPETLTQIDTAAPVPDRYNPGIGVGAGASVNGYDDDYIRISQYQRVTLPVAGEVRPFGNTSLSCVKDPTRPIVCAVARAVLEHVPQE